MATQPTPQLVQLAEVAATLGAPLGWVVNNAGKDVREWWTGEPAVTFDVARKIAEAWARNVADATETQRRHEAEQAAQIEREREQFAREREAGGSKQRGGVIPGGISVSVPGSPRPGWMGGEDE
jgi:hypothetical protein